MTRATSRFHSILTIFSSLCLSSTVLFADPITKNHPPTCNIILIGWDGVNREAIKNGLEKKKLPNLARLIEGGTIVDIDCLLFTDTRAGWAEILTGYGPELTGVSRNFKYTPIPSGYTIFERLENYFGPDKIATVALISKDRFMDAAPYWVASNSVKAESVQGFETKIVAGTKYTLMPAGQFLNTKDSLDLFRNAVGSDEDVVAAYCDSIDRYKNVPFFFFVHFGSADKAGHAYGEDSQQYKDAIVSSDLCLGKIVEYLKSKGLYEKTYIYVTADHGFDKGENHHLNAPYVFLATNDRQVSRRGERKDVAATILGRFGVPLDEINPPLGGHSLLRPYTPTTREE